MVTPGILDRAVCVDNNLWKGEYKQIFREKDDMFGLGCIMFKFSGETQRTYLVGL